MRNKKRLFIILIIGGILLFESIMLAITCIKTVFFQDYDPRSGIEIFTYMISIAGFLSLMLLVVKKEEEDDGFADYGSEIYLRCDNCDAEYTSDDIYCPNCEADV